MVSGPPGARPARRSARRPAFSRAPGPGHDAHRHADGHVAVLCAAARAVGTQYRSWHSRTRP
ncbi:hypothetical protein EY06_15210, partial [Staphylococcus aureus]